MDIRVRIAPSPTGDPHVGTAYIALFNMIFARHHGGKFILRIEDTDRSRSRPEYEDNIFNALRWCGIEWDEGPDIGGPHGPYRQSERTDIYRDYCQRLLDAGKAYKCFATADELAEMREIARKTGGRIGYDRRYRNLSTEEIEKREKEGQSYVVRLKVPLTGECEFTDAVKGKITTPYADIDDQILLKSDGYPTYHLANVIDDHLMSISHVIRGDEWISSTPKHILLYEAFGFTPPTFMHLPLLLGSDGKKLSKRKNPTSIFFYKDSGYLPEAMVNFLSLMGYSMTKEREIYTLKEIVEQFDPSRIGTSGAFFDISKLDWMNQQYIINTIPEKDLWNRIKHWALSDERMEQIIPLIHTRMKTFGEFIELSAFLFINHIPLTAELLTPKSITPETAKAMLQSLIWHMEEHENWSRSGIEEASRAIAEIFSVNLKNIVIKLIYTAIMGSHTGLPLFDSVQLLGKDKTRARFLKAIDFLGGLSKKKASELLKSYEQKDCSHWVEKTGTVS